MQVVQPGGTGRWGLQRLFGRSHRLDHHGFLRVGEVIPVVGFHEEAQATSDVHAQYNDRQHGQRRGAALGLILGRGHENVLQAFEEMCQVEQYLAPHGLG